MLVKFSSMCYTECTTQNRIGFPHVHNIGIVYLFFIVENDFVW